MSQNDRQDKRGGYRVPWQLVEQAKKEGENAQKIVAMAQQELQKECPHRTYLTGGIGWSCIDCGLQGTGSKPS